jgi:hypothetical protein
VLAADDGSSAPPSSDVTMPGKTMTNASFEQRMNSCVAGWSQAPGSDRGTMTYRQFTTKCVSGKSALPVNSTAACRDGSNASGASPAGACAENGGVAAWLQ